MATTKSSTVKRYNGVDYDTINPITTGQNVYGSGTQATTPLLDSNDKINSAFLPTIPTKTSDLTNDRFVRYDVNSQGLTNTQKSNARTNIGAGTSNLSLGITDTTAAYGNHLYHYWTNNQYYYDSYSGERNFRIITENAFADILRWQAGTINDKEYYDYTDSTWKTLSIDLAPLFDGEYSTGVSIPYANRKFRFTMTANSGWPTATLLVLSGSWFNSGTISKVVGSDTAYVIMTIETRASASDEWSEKVVCNYPYNCQNINGYSIASPLHTGNTLYRITIELGPWENTSNSASLRSLSIFSNYAGLGLRPYLGSSTGDLLPLSNNARNLGNSSYKWKNLHLNENIYLGSDVDYIKSYTDHKIGIYISNIEVAQFTRGSIYINNQLRGNIAPQQNNNGNLGTSSLIYANTYTNNISDGTNSVAISNIAKTNADNNFSVAQTFSSKVQLTNANHYIQKGSGNVVEIGANGNTILTIGSSSTAIASVFRANTDNSKDLGTSSIRWKDLYLSGNLTDGTNSVAITDITTNSDLLNYVPQTRTVNGKALSSDISLTASDVSALPSSTSYLASASVSGNTLTLTKADNTTQTFTPSFTDTNYYPSRSYSSGLQISTSQGVSNTCALFVPNASSSQAGVVSTAAQTFSGVKSFNSGIKLQEASNYYATLQGDSSVSSNITLTLPSSTGTLALVSDIPSGDVDVTINGTATSTVQTLTNIIVGTTTYKNLTTFTGTSTTTGTPSGTTTVPTSSHTHGITLIGTRTTSGSGTTARRILAITGSSSATSSTTTVASSGHNHTFTAQGSLS